MCLSAVLYPDPLGDLAVCKYIRPLIITMLNADKYNLIFKAQLLQLQFQENYMSRLLVTGE